MSAANAQDTSPPATAPAAVATAAGGQGRVMLEGGLVVGVPVALPTGLSTGINAAITGPDWLTWGARAAWSTATEYDPSWVVNHSDLRLRVLGIAGHSVGRGSFALRFGIGGTLVHETRTRNQGSRAGLTGSELETSAWTMLPGGDLELAITLGIVGAWSMVLSGGPSYHLRDGAVNVGWIGGLGVSWRR